jgi:aspartate aminotransferase
MNGIQSSPTLRLNALAQEKIKRGEDVINLTAGETDFPTSDAICAAAISGLKAGHTRYTPAHGIPELRAGAAKWFEQQWGLKYEAKQITTTCGVKQGLFNLLLATVQAGDEVIIPAPYWVSYPEMVRIAGGEPVIVNTDPSDGFQLRASAIATKLSKKTRLLLLNSPSNPSGTLLPKSELQNIAKILEGTDVLVASDEIYGSLVFDGQPFTSFAALSADAYQRTITFNGLSKSHAMTGWRVGFAAGDPKIIDLLGILQGQSATNVTSFVQDAAVAAMLEPASGLEEKCREMQARRDLSLQLLQMQKGVKIVKPGGAFYLFPDYSAFFGRKSPQGKLISGSEALAEYLLEDAGIAVVPGKPFGDDRCIRISIAREQNILRNAFARMLQSLQKL